MPPDEVNTLVDDGQVAEKVGLPMSWHTAPGAHYWFIWRQFLTEFAQILFRQPLS